jgi:hypothetical protein
MSMSIQDILAKVKSGEISLEDAGRSIGQLDKPKGKVYFKVSEKGAISLYGLQRMPVTLYVEQWESLLERVDELKEFIAGKPKGLKRKSEMSPDELEADKKRRAANFAQTRDPAQAPKPAAQTPPPAPPAQFWLDCEGGGCLVGPFASRPGANVFAQRLPDEWGPINTVSALPDGIEQGDIFTPSAIAADLGLPA